MINDLLYNIFLTSLYSEPLGIKTDTCSLLPVNTFGFNINLISVNAMMIAMMVKSRSKARIILWNLFFGDLEDKILLRIVIILLVTWLMNELEHAFVLPFVPDTVPFFFGSDIMESFAFE